MLPKSCVQGRVTFPTILDCYVKNTMWPAALYGSTLAVNATKQCTMKKRIITISIIGLVSLTLLSTTWFESTHKCPICNTDNQFQDVGSYGSYIYQWESKFQYIFWPLTDNPVVYSCKACHYSTYMWDFDSLDAAKIPLVKEYLKDKKLSVKTSDYLKVPITERLEIAEGVYNVLGRDDDFWCRFNRVKGYHYAMSRNDSKARDCRIKALEIAEKMRLNKDNEGRLKEILLITGGMKYFLNQKDSAKNDFRLALSLTYKSNDNKPDRDANINSYLDEVLSEYLKK